MDQTTADQLLHLIYLPFGEAVRQISDLNSEVRLIHRTLL